jgi:D-tyrosyl-tRNA(Tyr) deacylase
MRAVVQRVKSAQVNIEESMAGRINKGLLVFLGVGNDDTPTDVMYMVEKICGLRIFQDANDKMNLSMMDILGELLIVSQFTLFGDCKKGKRPGFSDAARPEIAIPLYELFVEQCRTFSGMNVQTGVFQADMEVCLVNDGPVTILIDSKKQF